MRQKTFILSIFITAFLFSCSNQQEKKVDNISVIELDQVDKPSSVALSTVKALAQLDKLLSEISEKPQLLTTSSNKETVVRGEKGTVIHIDPEKLETLDGKPVGDEIEIELLEMTDNSSLILNNAQTVSNGQILVTGGAYYINMTSNGKQLKMKQGQGFEVEFPKLTENEMGLFLGERDSLGQINWIPTNDSFETKNIPDAVEPTRPSPETAESRDLLQTETAFLADSIYAPKPVLKGDETEEEYQDYLIRKAAYDEQQKRIEFQRKTYEIVKLMNFGWINCDRFYSDPSPKTNIQVQVTNDSLLSARVFAVFTDMNSVMATSYWKDQKVTASFRNIPIGKELKIVALSIKDDTPYIFETSITSKIDQKVKVNFTATTQEQIKKRLEQLN